jgi:hypothetical protein
MPGSGQRQSASTPFWTIYRCIVAVKRDYFCIQNNASFEQGATCLERILGWNDCLLVHGSAITWGRDFLEVIPHKATDVLLFCLTHLSFVFQPTYAAYLNLIEPWWKTLRSLALKGRREDHLAGDRPSRGEGHGLLECASPPLRVGPTKTPSDAPISWYCCGCIFPRYLADVPLSSVVIKHLKKVVSVSD